MKKEQKQSQLPKKEFGDYLIGKTIGQGTFGKVKFAIHKLTNQHVAIKVLEKSKISEVADVERVSREIHILKLIRHPYIVQLYEIIETPKQLFLVMEYMQQGELFDYIVESKRINEEQACRMFHELISGIQYIHKIGVVHRDLKPENILLNYKRSIKVVDFGLSNTYKKNQLLKTPCGSPCYAAPEMIRGEKYEGLKVDLWSCGVILFAMLCGYLPFQDPDTPSLYQKILSGTYIFHKSISLEAKDLISKILNGDHNERFSIEDIRNHAWMKKHDFKESREGIIVGFNKIPIDNEVLQSMKVFEFEPDYVSKCLEANRHNNVTTAYYLALKKHIMEGGQTNCDLSSKSFDKSILQPNKRKNTNHRVTLDNFFTRSSQGDGKRRSKQKSRQRIEKQNKNIQNLISSLGTQTKKVRINSKNKINESLNYGRVPLSSKSVQKNLNKRESVMESKITRKYKQKFNQSLLSKSKDKGAVNQRSRVNSSINGCKRDLQGISTMLLEDIVSKSKKGGKKQCSNSIKCDTSKIIKARRL